MVYYFNPFVILLVPSVILCVILLFYAFLHRKESAIVPYFIVFEIFSLFWLLGYGLDLSAIDFESLMIAKYVKYVGVIFIGPTWLGLALMYTRRYNIFNNRLFSIYSFPPLLQVIYYCLQTNTTTYST